MHHKETYLDIFDESGNPTGEQKSYTEVHKNGYWHKSAHVWVIDPKGFVLLQRRSPRVHTFPGMWDSSAGGHIDAGETSVFAARRELYEEMGLLFPEEKFEYIGTIIDQYEISGGGASNEFDDIFLVVIENRDTPIYFNKDEVEGIAWIDFKEFEQKIKEKDPYYIQHQAEYDILFPILHRRFGNVVN